ncbi:hypothetical protein [Parafilimonas sp.]|uniref:hypothetical protein n=1 Tax=Parafilimonas sp. TaxID=1969739 RepID=UPI0039E3749A
MKYAKILLLSVSIFFFHFKSSAQIPHLNIYGHVLYASPLDNSSKDLYTGGAGVEAGVLIGRGKTMFNALIGTTRFFAKDDNQYGYLTYVPVKAGIRQYLPLTMHFLYIQGDAGLGFTNSRYLGNDGTRFAADIGAGVKFGLFDAAVIWDNIHESDPKGWASWLTIKAGLNLGF